MMKTILLVLGISMPLWLIAQGQFPDNYNPIITSMPTLQIEGKTFNRGMAEIGVVSPKWGAPTSSIYNPALLLYGASQVMDTRLSLIPWRGNSSGQGIDFYNLGTNIPINERHGIGLDIRYHSLGTIISNNGVVVSGGSGVRESIIAAQYAFKLTPSLTLGAGLKYIFSDLDLENFFGAGLSFQAIQTLAGSLGLHYQNTHSVGKDLSLNWQMGLAFLNLGRRVSYIENLPDNAKDYIPANAQLGVLVGIEKNINELQHWTIDLAYQMDKLMVPSACSIAICDENGNGVNDNKEQSVFSSWWSSFSDAPRGREEEWEELTHKVGMAVQYVFAFSSRPHLENSIGLRSGRYNQHANKGDLKYWSLGLTVQVFGAFIEYDQWFQEASRVRTEFPYNRSFSIGYRRAI